jgi:hypothetical protein
MMTLDRRGLFGLLLLPFMPGAAFAHDDKERIVHLMKSIFDKPDNPLAEEAKLDPALVAQFDLFEGTVDMSGHTAPESHGAQGAHKHGTETQTQ